MSGEIEWRFDSISIEVKCPKCGRWGKLTSKGRKSIISGVKLTIRHKSEKSVSTETCSVGTCSEHYEELLEIYTKCRG